jgi:hypothetical protein
MVEGEKADRKSEAGGEIDETGKPRRAIFANLPRELTPKDLSTGAARRFLLDESDRLHQEVSDLKSFRDRFYEADKERGILQEKLKRSISAEVIYGICLSVGSLLIPVAIEIWESRPYGWILLISGAVLYIGGVVSRILLKT